MAERVNRSRGRIIGAATLVILIGLGLVALVSTVEVVDKGTDLRPYDSGRVFKVRIADSFTFYADEESRVQPDLVTGSALVVLATVALMAALLLRAATARHRLTVFYSLAGIGFAYLALDELVAVHETLGHNLVFLAEVPGIERPDDLLFALYSLPAIAFAIYFRDILTDSTIALRLFIVGAVVFGCAGVADITDMAGKADEVLEAVAGLCVGTAFLLLIATHLRAPTFETPDAAGNGPTGPSPSRVPVGATLTRGAITGGEG